MYWHARNKHRCAHGKLYDTLYFAARKNINHNIKLSSNLNNTNTELVIHIYSPGNDI